MTSGSTGLCAVVRALATSPLAGIDDAVELEPQPRPDPADLAADDVLVEVHAANVGWVDLLMTSGQYQHVPEPPYTPGLEYAGVVVWRGPAVTSVEVGARVIADGLRTGPRSLGDHRRWGGFARWAVAPADAVLPLPTPLSFDEGACLLGGSETAYHALVHRARVQPGETVLVLGATGSTGLAAVALAKRLGATVIAVGRSVAKLAKVGAYGADHLLQSAGDTPRFAAEVKRLTEGRGADVIYDPLGGAASIEALRAAAFGARFVVVGWSSTPQAARGGREANVLPTNLILMKGLDVLGSPAAISVHRDPSVRSERLASILAWANAGELRPHVGATFPLSALPAAMHAKWAGAHVGNIVVHPLATADDT